MPATREGLESFTRGDLLPSPRAPRRLSVQAMSAKWVYEFEEGSGGMSELLGGKGAGIAEMVRAGMPVPPGFTITTEACRAYLGADGQPPQGMWEQVEAALGNLEQKADRRLGTRRNRCF